MREIKFRAWIYGLGKMTPVKEIDFDGHMSSVMVEINSERHEQMFFENTDYPDCELMQCTGIKDKNGKEIYEGDIIEYKTVYEWDKKLIKRAEVVFENGMFSPAGVIMDLSRSKIIGNIYENPELVK